MNELRRLSEFQEILKNYQISDQNSQLLKDVKLCLLVSPSSVGRNTIIRELMKSGSYHFVISDTTRQPRVNDDVPEKNGVNYWFRTEDEVLQGLKQGEFLEAAIIHDQQVSGISLRELRKAHDDNKIAITDLEVVGVANIKQLKPDTIAIFVLPPNFEEWQRRLNDRGNMSAHEYQNRMHSAVKELRESLDKDYYLFVINDDLSQAVANVDKILKTNQIDADYQAKCCQLAKDLLLETEKYLKNIETGTLDS